MRAARKKNERNAPAILEGARTHREAGAAFGILSLDPLAFDMTATFAPPPPAPEAALRALEEKLAAALPPVLRGCYAASNGGRFGDPRQRDGEWQLHPVFDSSDRKQMKRTAEDVLHYTRLALQDTRFPRDGISIAHDYSMYRQLFVRRDPATGAIAEDILLFDAHTDQWSAPYAADLQAAIDQARIPEAVQPDPARALPEFRYYADPFESGVMRTSGESCQCCGQATGYIYGGSFYAIPQQSQNKTEAWALIKYLTTNKAQQVLAFKTTGAFPALRSASTDTVFNEGVPYLGNQKARLQWRNAATKIQPLDVNKLDPVAEQIVNDAIAKVLDGSMDIRGALTEAQQLITRRAR